MHKFAFAILFCLILAVKADETLPGDIDSIVEGSTDPNKESTGNTDTGNKEGTGDNENKEGTGNNENKEGTGDNENKDGNESDKPEGDNKDPVPAFDDQSADPNKPNTDVTTTVVQEADIPQPPPDKEKTNPENGEGTTNPASGQEGTTNPVNDAKTDGIPAAVVDTAEPTQTELAPAQPEGTQTAQPSTPTIATPKAQAPTRQPRDHAAQLRTKLLGLKDLYKQKEVLEDTHVALQQEKALSGVLEEIKRAKSSLKDFPLPRHITLHPRHVERYYQRKNFGMPLEARPQPSLYFNRPGKPTKIPNYFEADHDHQLYSHEYYPTTNAIKDGRRAIDRLERYRSTIPNYRLINQLMAKEYYDGTADLPYY